jgi:hypothetical protein
MSMSDDLERLENDLGAALELVVRDVLTAGLARSEAEELVWTLAEWRLDNALASEPAGVTALAVAEDAQERLIEGRHEHCWPRCPIHPNHPLWLAGSYPDRAWTCTGSGTKVADLGQLDHGR